MPCLGQKITRKLFGFPLPSSLSAITVNIWKAIVYHLALWSHWRLQTFFLVFGINVELCDVLPFIDGLVLVQECFACQARQYWSSLTLSVIQVWFWYRVIERDCHMYHHHLHPQLETLVFRGQYLRWSSWIEILFGTSTKVEVNLAFSNAVIIIVITISNHKSHVNPSNKHHHLAITIPIVTVTIFNIHPYYSYYHLHPNSHLVV